jgi:hypothetical protein
MALLSWVYSGSTSMRGATLATVLPAFGTTGVDVFGATWGCNILVEMVGDVGDGCRSARVTVIAMMERELGKKEKRRQ